MRDYNVRAGELRHRITILAVTNTVADDGSLTVTATTIDTVWGDHEEVAAGSPVVASMVTPETTDVVKIRPFSAINLTTKHRLRVNGKTLEIIGIMDVKGRKRLTQINCKALV
jgi:head-tail adaptor